MPPNISQRAADFHTPGIRRPLFDAAALLFLTMPLFSRLLDAHVPGLIVNGPADFPIFGAGLQWAQAMGFVFAAWQAGARPRRAAALS